MRAGQNRGAGQSTDYGYPNTYGRRLTPRPLFMPVIRRGFLGARLFPNLPIDRSMLQPASSVSAHPVLRTLPCLCRRGAEDGFASGRTDCASLWFLFTHSVSSWSPAVSRRRSASQAWFRIPCFRGSIRIQIGVCPAFRVSYFGNGSKSSNKVRPCAPRVAIARSVQTP